MTTSNIQDQDGNITPPRVKYVINQSVDSTSRAYDLTQLKFLDESHSVGQGNVCNFLWLDLEAIGGDVYFAFSSTAAGSAETIDDTIANAAGTPWLLSGGNSGFTPPSGAPAWAPAHITAGTIRPVRIDRQVDKTLILKCSSGTATLIITPSSQSLPGATRGA